MDAFSGTCSCGKKSASGARTRKWANRKKRASSRGPIASNPQQTTNKKIPAVRKMFLFLQKSPGKTLTYVLPWQKHNFWCFSKTWINQLVGPLLEHTNRREQNCEKKMQFRFQLRALCGLKWSTAHWLKLNKDVLVVLGEPVCRVVSRCLLPITSYSQVNRASCK